jgi:regulator of protease activity HflC (stomatin/prohibitin superfamily)
MHFKKIFIDILDKQTEPWGIKVSLVETKQVDLPA